VLGALSRVVEGWQELRSDRGMLLKITIVSEASILLQSLRLLVAYRALGYDTPWNAVLLVAMAGGFVELLSVVPGGLVLREAAIGAMGVALGNAFGVGVVAGTLDRAASMIVIFAIGPFALHHLVSRMGARSHNEGGHMSEADTSTSGLARRVVVVIPALNEEATVGEVVRAIPREMPGAVVSHVVVVDDGSTDKTAEVAAAAGAVVVSHPRNLGSGAAFGTGRFKAVDLGADIICHIDADGQFDPADIPKLLEPILKGEADFATCTRFARKELEPEMPRVKKWGNHMVTRLVNWASGSRFTDASCGFRAYTRETAHHLHLFSKFDYAQETLMLLSRGHLRLVEVPLPVRGVREHGESRIAGSVLGYGARCFSILMLTMRDMYPIRFFGAIGAFFLGAGVFLGAWVLAHWLRTGHTAPYTMFLTGSALGVTLGILLYVLALVADMVVRQRAVQERVMFEVRTLKDSLESRGHKTA
jgi:glycosyltransferase involved in cell wall biosynthesis